LAGLAEPLLYCYVLAAQALALEVRPVGAAVAAHEGHVLLLLPADAPHVAIGALSVFFVHLSAAALELAVCDLRYIQLVFQLVYQGVVEVSFKVF